MKVLLLTISCKRHRGAEQRAIEQTWLADKSWFDHRFLLGRGNENPSLGELIVDADDSYNGLSQKVRMGYKWALDNGYDYVFISCIDTYVYLPRLRESGFWKQDYVGFASDGGHASGGMGYWLSKRAMHALVNNTAGGAASDVADFLDLRRALIPLVHDDRYWNGDMRYTIEWPPPWENGIISVHLSNGTANYSTDRMFACHETAKRMINPVKFVVVVTDIIKHNVFGPFDTAAEAKEFGGSYLKSWGKFSVSQLYSASRAPNERDYAALLNGATGT